MGFEEAPPSDNLYITDLPANCTEEMLREMFGPAIVQCRVLPPKSPNQTDSVALVRFSSQKAAMVVRETLNGAVPPGQTRPVTIRYNGKPGVEKGKGKGSDGSSYGPMGSSKSESSDGPYSRPNAPGEPSDNLYITGLPPGIDNDVLKTLFSQYGPVVQCKVLQKSPELPCHGLVRYGSVDEATAVKTALTGFTMEGMTEPMNIQYAIEKKREDKGASKGGSWGSGWFATKPAVPAAVSAGETSSFAGWNSWDWWTSMFASAGSWASSGSGSKGGSKGGNKGGVEEVCGMDRIIQGFEEAQCLPGHDISNDENALYIAGLPSDCEDIHLYRLMAPFGAIPPDGVKAVKHADGSCKGYGFVYFIDPSALQTASLLLHGTQLPDGSTLSVMPKKDKPADDPAELQMQQLQQFAAMNGW